MQDVLEITVSRSLVLEARDGNRQAMGELVGSHVRYVRKEVHARFGSCAKLHLEEEDVVQQTLLEACRDMHRFSGTTEAEFRGWLKRIVFRNLLDSKRYWMASKRCVSQEVYLEDLQAGDSLVVELGTSEDSCPRGICAVNESMAAIRHAVSSLPCDQSAIIRYRLFQQLDFEEIGQRMGRSESAVRSLWGRAVKRLRVRLRNAV